MVMIDPTLFESEWFVNLSVDERYMYLYLLVNSSNKTGAFEWNQRMINFCANTNKVFTKEDILSIYGGRIQMVPGRSNTMIIVDYVRFNWLKEGREFDPERNRLDKAIAKELGSLGLTIDKLNEMSKHKIQKAKPIETPKHQYDIPQKVVDIKTSVSKKDADEMFNSFWTSYPSCSRKVNKKVCEAKFRKILGDDSDEAISTFNKIMAGLDKWKRSKDWEKDGGQYICAPLVWLNQERWDAELESGQNTQQTIINTAEAKANTTEAIMKRIRPFGEIRRD